MTVNRYLQFTAGAGARDSNEDISSVIIALVGVFCLYTIFFLLRWRLRRAPSQDAWIQGGDVNNTSMSTFVGIGRDHKRYRGHYFQHASSHDVPMFRLTLLQTGEVEGRGSDKIGSYILTGKYRGCRLAVSKTYIPNTGNLDQNFGQSVEFRLEYKMIKPGFTWSRLPTVYTEEGILHKYGFVGKWYLHLPHYVGKGTIAFWLVDGEGVFNPEQGQPPMAALVAEAELQVPSTYVDGSLLQRHGRGHSAAPDGMCEQVEKRIGACVEYAWQCVRKWCGYPMPACNNLPVSNIRENDELVSQQV